MALDRGQIIELVVEQPVAGGRMLARHDGQIVLVAGAIPGERVRAVIEPSPKRVTFARVVDVVEPSADRREPPADLACGGLVYGHIRPERQRALKALVIADAFRRIAKMPLDEPPPVAASPEDGYRLRARLHVRHGRVGFFREQTHELCDAAATRQLRDGAVEAAADVVARLGSGAERLDSIIVAENVRGDARVLHLVPQPVGRNFSSAEPEPQSVGRNFSSAEPKVGADAPAGVTGVTVGSQGAPATLIGVGILEDSSADVLGAIDGVPPLQWRRHAASFFQANRFLVGPLAAAVLRHAEGERVVDLYAGVGLFSVPLAARGARVLAVEGDVMSAADLDVNAAPWPTLEVFHGAVEDALAQPPAAPPDTIVVDPPRTGMSPDAVGALIRWEARRVVYVSCDPPTLARDARSLLAAGYALAHIEAFDFFPNTAHVETLAVFDKS